MNSDELMDGLRRLAPEVDTEEALASLGQPRRPLVPPVGAWLALALAVIVAAGVLLATRGPDREGVVAGPGTTTPTAAPLSADTVQDGIQLTVTLPAGQGAVGTRVEAHVRVRNVGSVPIAWEAGGCAIPAQMLLRPAGSTEAGRAPTWDGSTPLQDWLKSGNALRPKAFTDPAGAGIRLRVCTSDSRPLTIPPGGDTSWAGVADLRIPPGPVPAYELVATFVAYEAGRGAGDPSRPEIVVRMPVPIGDDPTRAGSAEDAIDAFASDHRLQSFLDETREVGGPAQLTQSWHTELSWWQGAWELWVYPYYARADALRLRYGVTERAVIDARVISMTAVPSDDPAPRSRPGQTPETVLP